MRNLILIILLTFMSSTQAKLWDVTNQWNLEWEVLYSDWFQASFDRQNLDFFEKHNMATDCADVAIAARWIFARKNGLPVLQHSATTYITDKQGNKVRAMYSQNISKRYWEAAGLKADLSKPWHQDQLFVKALNYVLDNTNTYSLSWDSYPIEISKKAMLVGTHHLTFYPKGAHANILYNLEYFKRVNGNKTHRTVALNMLNSTLPKKVRVLYTGHYTRGQKPSKRGNEGFLRMRWPTENSDGTYDLLERESHPFWSEEQYEEQFMRGHGAFYHAIVERMWPEFSFNYADLELMIKSINTELKQRISIVIKGYNLCFDDPSISHDDDKVEDCSPGTKNYDKYSTNNRDDRFQALMTATKRTFDMYKDDRKYKRRIRQFMKSKVKLSGSKSANYHQVEFLHIVNAFTLRDFMSVSERRDAEFLFSSDPRVHFYNRWGMNK